MPSNETALREGDTQLDKTNITSSLLNNKANRAHSIRNLISFYETTYGASTQKEANKPQRQHSTPPVPIANSQSSFTLMRYPSVNDHNYRRSSYVPTTKTNRYSQQIDDYIDDDDVDDDDDDEDDDELRKKLEYSSLIEPKINEVKSRSARLLFYSKSFYQTKSRVESKIDALKEVVVNSKSKSYSSSSSDSQSSTSSSPLSLTPPLSPSTHNYKEFSQDRAKIADNKENLKIDDSRSDEKSNESSRSSSSSSSVSRADRSSTTSTSSSLTSETSSELNKSVINPNENSAHRRRRLEKSETIPASLSTEKELEVDEKSEKKRDLYNIEKKTSTTETKNNNKMSSVKQQETNLRSSWSFNYGNKRNFMRSNTMTTSTATSNKFAVKNEMLRISSSNSSIASSASSTSSFSSFSSNEFSPFFNRKKIVNNFNFLRKEPTLVKQSSLPPNSKRFDPRTIQKMVLEWCQNQTKNYKNVNITNFSSSWADGLAFCALVHSFLPDSFDFNKLVSQNRRQNFELAFDVAYKRANIVPLLEAGDMIKMGNRPDDRCVFTYVSTIYSKFQSLNLLKTQQEQQQQLKPTVRSQLKN